MKIGFVTHVFPRLHNTFILNEIVELLRLGHEVYIISVYRSQETVYNKDVIDLKLLERTLYFESFQLPDVNNLLEYKQFAQELGNSVHAIKPLAQQLRSMQIDVLHGAFGALPASAALALSRASGIPFTFESHAYDLFVSFLHSQEKINECLFITTESEYNRGFLVQGLGASDEKVKIVPLAPNKRMLDKVSPSQKNSPSLVSASRLHPIKGLRYAIDAVSRLKVNYPNISYQIIGDGTLRDELEQQVRALNLTENVTFLSDVSNEEVCRRVSQSDVFILPCVIAPDGDRDGTPTAICEAMYLELPVISSNISGLPELVSHGESGFLAEPGNVDQIVEYATLLLNDPAQRQAFGRKGKQIIDQKYNIHTNVAMLVKHWEEAIK